MRRSISTHTAASRRRSRPIAVVHQYSSSRSQASLNRTFILHYQAFHLGAAEEAASVDDDRIRAGVIGADRLDFGPKPCEDAVTVDQRLGADERDHADGRLAGSGIVRDGGAGEVGAKIGRVLDHPCAMRQVTGPGKCLTA